jgi:hypothetical protein
MNLRFCIDSAEKRALGLCCGSMDDDSGNCNGYGSDACSDGFGCGEDIGAVLGGGYGVGYGGWRYGDGFSSEEWR